MQDGVTHPVDGYPGPSEASFRYAAMSARAGQRRRWAFFSSLLAGRQRLIEHLRENGVAPIPVGRTKHHPSLRSLARRLHPVGGGAPPSCRQAHSDLPTPSIRPMQDLPEREQGPAGDWNG
jgi:hypothetical protein